VWRRRSRAARTGTWDWDCHKENHGKTHGKTQDFIELMGIEDGKIGEDSQ